MLNVHLKKKPIVLHIKDDVTLWSLKMHFVGGIKVGQGGQGGT